MAKLSFRCLRAPGLKAYELLLHGQDQRHRQVLGAFHALLDPTGMHQARLFIWRGRRDGCGGILDCEGISTVDSHSVAV